MRNHDEKDDDDDAVTVTVAAAIEGHLVAGFRVKGPEYFSCQSSGESNGKEEQNLSGSWLVQVWLRPQGSRSVPRQRGGAHLGVKCGKMGLDFMV